MNFEKLLTRVLAEEAIDLHKLIIGQRISRPVYQAYTGEQIPTQIAFDNDMSDSRTFIEVETEDRIGLLYTIASTLAELEVDISTARILTEKGAAIDSFYVRELDGGKILAPERQQGHRTPPAPRHQRPGRGRLNEVSRHFGLGIRFSNCVRLSSGRLSSISHLRAPSGSFRL
jgi:hypothetical protein